MNRLRRSVRAPALALALAVAAVAAPLVARAQDAGDSGSTGDERPQPARVYIPFEDLKKVFETEGQGVFVPYAEFRELWKRAMDRAPETAPPAGVTTALYEGTIEGDLAIVRATLDILCGTDGESAVPIGLGGAVIGEATLDGESAVLISSKAGRRVVVRGKGAHRLEITLVAPVTPTNGDRTVAFPSAGAPVSRLSFAIPGEGVKVTVDPNLATTRTDEGSGVTRVMAYVGAAPELRLTWRPRPVETAGSDAIVHAQTEVLHRVSEQTLETRLFVRFDMMRGGAREFRVAFPADQQVLQVEGEAIRTWSEVDLADGSRSVLVELHDEAEGSYALRLLLESPRTAGDTSAVLPVLTFPGTAREAGIVAVQVLPPIAVRPSVADGLYRVPTTELSSWMQTGKGDLAPGVTVLAWRYAGRERSLEVSVETVAPEVTVAERSVLDLAPGAARLRAALDLTVERAGLFQAVVRLPDGWELESSHVATPGGWQAVDARVEGEGAARRVLIDLGTRRIGAVPLLVTLRRALELGDEADALVLPVVSVVGAARTRGVFAVAADESLDVRTGDVVGFVPAEPVVLSGTTFPAEVATADARLRADPHPILFGFRHAGEERSGTLTIVRRKPLVTAETVTVAGVEEDGLHVRHGLRFVVRYAGVDTFRFVLPATVTERVRIEGAGIKERTHAVSEDDATEVIHTVVLQSPTVGEVMLSIQYDIPEEPLAVGASRTLTVPPLRALGVERDQGWYAVTRDPALSVEGHADGLQYADAREVPAWAGAANVFLAWRRQRQPHGLTLDVAKHEPVPILQAVVNALALDTLVGGGGVALTEARMDVQVNGLQYLRVGLPAGAAVESAEVDGRPVSPRREADVLLLACPAGKSRDDRFGVRLVYRQETPDAEGRSFTVDLVAPRMPQALVQGTAWTCWVPPDAVLFSGGGNLRAAERSSVFATILGSLADTFGARGQTGRPTTGGEALPPEVTLSVAGRSAYSFQRTGEDAHLDARFVSRTAVGVFGALAALLTLAAAWWLASRRAIRARWSSLGAIAVALVLFPTAAPGMRTVLACIAGAGCVVALGGAVAAFRRERRVAARARPAAEPAARVASPPPAPEPESTTESATEGESPDEVAS